ncbi:MAG: Gfo/Idh/MocA family oxidoreductase [Thermomicrobiaceae bacterium]
MGEKRLKVGVIGTGYGASVHIPGLKQLPEVDVVAVCATRKDHALRAAHQYGLPEHYDDFREMLQRSDIDAVTIAVPPGQQHSIAIACAEHDVHILCEKPMAASAAEARDMYRLVEEAKVCHSVNFQSRYVPVHQRFKELIDKGFIGDLESVTVTGYRMPWKVRRSEERGWVDDGERSAGLLNAVGSEYVDILRWCFGEFDSVSGSVTTGAAHRSSTNPRESSFSILLRFASGASGTVSMVSSSTITLGDEIVASGEDGLMVLQSDGQLFGTRRDDHRVAPIEVDNFDPRELAAVRNPRVLPFIILANDWVRRILEEHQSARLPSFYDGMKVQEVLHGVQRSERLSRWIDLSDKKWPVQW